MLLPEILHLPAVMLLVMVVGSGISLIAGIPFAIHTAHSSLATAFGVLVGLAVANLTTWYGFRAALKAKPNAHFLGFTSRIWSITIPLAYCSGIAFGVYLFILFYF
jgi:hypothetical protein